MCIYACTQKANATNPTNATNQLRTPAAHDPIPSPVSPAHESMNPESQRNSHNQRDQPVVPSSSFSLVLAVRV